MKVYTIYGEVRSVAGNETGFSSGVVAVFTDPDKALNYIRKHFNCKNLPYKDQYIRTYEDANGIINAKSFRRYEGPEGTESSELFLETFESDEFEDPNEDIVHIY